MTKTTDLQPWLDYFDLLGTYERKGFIEVMPDKHEAYVTQPAIFTLADADVHERLQTAKAVFDVALRIRAYAAWQSQEGQPYLKQNFALHVVEPEHPHNLLYTLLLTQTRRWLRLWRKTDSIEVITYQTKRKQV